MIRYRSCGLWGSVSKSRPPGASCSPRTGLSSCWMINFTTQGGNNVRRSFSQRNPGSPWWQRDLGRKSAVCKSPSLLSGRARVAEKQKVRCKLSLYNPVKNSPVDRSFQNKDFFLGLGSLLEVWRRSLLDIKIFRVIYISARYISDLYT